MNKTYELDERLSWEEIKDLQMELIKEGVITSTISFGEGGENSITVTTGTFGGVDINVEEYIRDFEQENIEVSFLEQGSLTNGME